MLSEKSRYLSLMSAAAHIFLGIAVWTNSGVVGKSPAFAYFPDWLWPTIFMLIGLSALAGFYNLKWLRFSLYAGSAIMVMWGCASFFSTFITGQVQPSTLWLFYIGGLKWMVAEYALKLKKVQDSVATIAEEAANAGSSE